MLIILQMVGGFAILIGGAQALIHGAERLSLALGISPLLVGLTVVAYGTSAPELAVNISAVLEDPPRLSLVVGNVVGSNISNILLVLGVTAIVAPLVVPRRLVRTTLPFMVVVSLLVYVVGADGVIARAEGMALFAGSIAYTVVLVVRERRHPSAGAADAGAEPGSILGNGALVLVGLVLLIFGADMLVEACVAIARMLAVSELIIGLSIVAVGTSLPELATSIVACLKGRRDLAVGNLVGSNIFNILLVMGLGASFSPAGIVVEETALEFDIVLMIFVAVVCIPIFASDLRINRWEGVLLFTYYVFYVISLYLNHEGLVGIPIIQQHLIYMTTPLIVVALLSVVYRFVKGITPE